MLLELDIFKVLFYEESVDVVTSGHVTKMAVTPFDPQWPITPYYTQTSRLYLLQNRSYCRLKKVLHGGNREFRVFLRKIVEIIKIFWFASQKGRSGGWNTFFDPLPTVLACILPELQAFKMLFYTESVGVVTSGHVTKMSVIPFDPQWPITPYYTQISRLYLLQNRSFYGSLVWKGISGSLDRCH